MNIRRIALIAALSLVPFGCSDDEAPTPEPPGCAEGNEVGEACAGVPSGKLCDGASCAPSSCSSVTTVTNDAELSEAVANANDGDCIILSPGNYAQLDMAAKGIGVFAEGPDSTSVGTVTTGGSGAEVRGVAATNVNVTGGDVRLSAVRISGSPQDGVSVSAGASVTVEQSEIRQSGRYGVSAFDSGSVDLSYTIVEGTEGPGVWMQCGDTPCSCATDLQGAITHTVIANAKIVGLSIVDASVTIDNVEVRDTTVGGNFEAGGGVSIAHCADVMATDLRVLNSADFGILVHDSSFVMNGGQVDNNLRGVWMQQIGASQAGAVASVTSVTLDGNLGVGIGVDGGSLDVSVSNSTVSNTANISLPVLVNGVSAASEQVGDGFSWLGLSSVTLSSVTVENSARTGLLIDGEVGANSSIADLTLNETGEKGNIIQQNFVDGGTEPVTSGMVPPGIKTADELFAIPEDVVPPGI
ncbi:MAG TPA: right-handed parallel beta-helix repeat-containing protein [Polyangiaceae bacterium]|nr:right-handed parallel beta-helix repeat-containing protein [Polyangiaceae bacterium]